jgi:hypothetical protein
LAGCFVFRASFSSTLLSIREPALAAAWLRLAIGGGLRLRLITGSRSKHWSKGGHSERKQTGSNQSSNHVCLPQGKAI